MPVVLPLRHSTIATLKFPLLHFSIQNCHPQILNSKMQEGEFEGGIAKDPKRKNFEIWLSPPRGG